MITEKEYKKALATIEELINKVGNDTDINDPNFIKLDNASDIVLAYEIANYTAEDIKEMEFYAKTEMTYKGFVGTINYSQEDNVYWGKLTKTTDLITYEADSRATLQIAFQKMIDLHLADEE